MTKTELEQTVLDYFKRIGKVLDRSEYRRDSNVPVPYTLINRGYGSYLRFYRFMTIRFKKDPKPVVVEKKQVEKKQVKQVKKVEKKVEKKAVKDTTAKVGATNDK